MRPFSGWGEMKTTRRECVARILTVASCLFGAAVPLRAAPRKQNDSDLCKLILRLSKKVYEEGKEIKVSLHFRNVSLEPLTIWSSGFWRNHKVVVTDTKGKELPLSELGKQYRKIFSPGGPRDKNIPVVVGPGETYQVQSNVDLTKLYDLEPGKYRVQAVYEDVQDSQSLRIVSNRVTFEVK